MPPHQSGTAQSASTECLIGDPMHLMEKPIDCFNIVSGERIFDDRPNLLKSFSWSHGSPRHQAASASRGTMEAARWEVFWHLHLTLLSARRDWSSRPQCGCHAGGEGGIRTHERVAPLAVFKFSARRPSRFVLLLSDPSKSLSYGRFVVSNALSSLGLNCYFRRTKLSRAFTVPSRRLYSCFRRALMRLARCSPAAWSRSVVG